MHGSLKVRQRSLLLPKQWYVSQIINLVHVVPMCFSNCVNKKKGGIWSFLRETSNFIYFVYPCGRKSGVAIGPAATQVPVQHPIWFPIVIAVPPRNAMLNDSAHRTKPEQLDPRKAKWYKMIDDLREMEGENAISLLFRYSVL